jgi:hypothetical protein
MEGPSIRSIGPAGSWSRVFHALFTPSCLSCQQIFLCPDKDDLVERMIMREFKTKKTRNRFPLSIVVCLFCLEGKKGGWRDDRLLAAAGFQQPVFPRIIGIAERKRLREGAKRNWARPKGYSRKKKLFCFVSKRWSVAESESWGGEGAKNRFRSRSAAAAQGPKAVEFRK